MPPMREYRWWKEQISQFALKSNLCHSQVEIPVGEMQDSYTFRIGLIIAMALCPEDD
jgi:hypothetical protein